MKKLSYSTKTQIFILLAGIILAGISCIIMNYLHSQQSENLKKVQLVLQDYNLKLNIIKDHNAGQRQNIVLGKIDKNIIIQELKAFAKDLSYISYEFKSLQPINFNYAGKNIYAQPVVLKIKSIADSQIYDFVDQIKNSNLGLVQFSSLLITKIRDIDDTVLLQDLQNKDIDIFQTVLEFKVIGYA